MHAGCGGVAGLTGEIGLLQTGIIKGDAKEKTIVFNASPSHVRESRDLPLLQSTERTSSTALSLSGAISEDWEIAGTRVASIATSIGLERVVLKRASGRASG